MIKRLLQGLSVAVVTLLGDFAAAARVERLNWNVVGTVDKPRVIELLRIRLGVELGVLELERALTRIAETGDFARVAASLDTNGTLNLELKAISRIGDVRIELRGASDDPIPEFLLGDIQDILGVSTGDTVFTEVFDEIRGRVLARLRDRGFLAASALIALEEVPGLVGQRLLVGIDLGVRARLSEIRFRGSSNKLASEFLRFLRGQGEFEGLKQNFLLPISNLIGAGGEDQAASDLKLDVPFDWIAFGNANQAFLSLLRARGFYDVQGKLEVVSVGANRFSIEQRLNHGPRYRLQFDGNVKFWTRDLRLLATEKTLRLGLPFSSTEVTRQILRKYREKGYEKVKVVAESIDVESENSRIVRFEISEGERSLLGDLKFEGVSRELLPEVEEVGETWRDSFESPIVRHPFDFEMLKARSRELLVALRRKGFLQARILEVKQIEREGSRFRDLEINLQLGQRFTLASLTVLGNTLLTEGELDALIPVSIGDPVDPIELVESLGKIRDRYRSLGFVNVELPRQEESMLRFIPGSTQVDVTIEIKPGVQFFVGRTFAQGMRRSQERVITRELEEVGLVTGQPWAPAKVLAVESRLLGLGLFSSARLEPMGGRELVTSLGRDEFLRIETAERDLRVLVQEKAPGSIEFGPGYRTDLGLVGVAEYVYRNLGGMNRTISLKAQGSRKLNDFQFVEQRYSVTFLEPYIFDLPWRLRLSAAYAKDDQVIFNDGAPFKGFNSEETTFGAAIDRQITRTLRLTQNLYTISLPRLFGIVDPDAVSLVQSQKYRIGSVGTQIVYDDRDSLFAPQRGILSISSAEYSAPWLASTEDAHFVIARQAFTTYFLVGSPSVLALSVSYSHLWGLGNSGGVPENKRLSLGGRSSIRSLRERALSSDAPGLLEQRSAEVKLEYRQPVLLDFGLAYFLDAGLVDSIRFRDSNERSLSGLRKGLGFGFRYATPVGPLALDFAFNLDRKADLGEDLFQVQFNIGSF